jgi:hypothetical protein
VWLLPVFYLLFQDVEMLACFLRPCSMGVFAEIVFPVGDGLAVEEELFAGQGAVEEGDGIVGIFGERLAQRLDGVAVIEGAICALSAHVISRTKVSEQGGGIGGSQSCPQQGFDGRVVVSIEQVGAGARFEPGGIIGIFLELLANQGFGF